MSRQFTTLNYCLIGKSRTTTFMPICNFFHALAS